MSLSIPRRDPENAERSLIQRYHSQPQGHVLDIGCGDGRMTWNSISNAELVVGIDIDMNELRNANCTRAEVVSTKVGFISAEDEALPFVIELFNLALFSWSF